MPDESQVMQALINVIDPELGINVVELGMVGDIEIDGDGVLVNMRLTSMSCPFWDLFVDQVKIAVGAVAGIGEVTVQFDRRQPWTPDLMSASARAELESVGLMPPSMRGPAQAVDRSELVQLVEGVLSAPLPRPIRS